MPVICVVHPKERSAAQSAVISKRSQHFVLTVGSREWLDWHCVHKLKCDACVTDCVFENHRASKSRAQNNILSIRSAAILNCLFTDDKLFYIAIHLKSTGGSLSPVFLP